MRKSRFSEEQIIGILKEHQAGIATTEICRKHGISDADILRLAAKIWRHGHSLTALDVTWVTRSNYQ